MSKPSETDLPPEYLISSYDFHLPEESIAQAPAARRDASRLLHLDCLSDRLRHGVFSDVADLLRKDDLLVVNNTRVFPARLNGRKETGGKIEFMLLHYPMSTESGGAGRAVVQGLLKASKRPKTGARLIFGDDLLGEVVCLNRDATVSVELCWRGELDGVLKRYGQVPLPPYIKRAKDQDGHDHKRYQTVYAGENGAVAAPTAGLHFTPELLSKVKDKGARLAELTLHVGYGTFAPVRVEDIRKHQIHAERVTVPPETRDLIAQTREAGGRVWAVGTTSARTLEFAADDCGGVESLSGDCRLYIYPGYKFKVVDVMVTNFHLPRSSLLFMVSAFAGRERLLAAYESAIKKGYRFYSYGDAMVITR